jgi:hypothetical protein
VTVKTYLLGDKNPEWHEPPVIVSIVSLMSPVISHCVLTFSRWSENPENLQTCTRNVLLGELYSKPGSLAVVVHRFLKFVR